MTHMERLSEIIRADFEEDDVVYPKLNVKKLLRSDFIDRFLGFVEAYDELYGKNVFDTVEDWLYKDEYYNIKYFLNTSSIEYNIPFTIQDFIYMTPNEIFELRDKCAKICALLDEKRVLYQEFNTFYE